MEYGVLCFWLLKCDKSFFCHEFVFLFPCLDQTKDMSWGTLRGHFFTLPLLKFKWLEFGKKKNQ